MTDHCEDGMRIWPCATFRHAAYFSIMNDALGRTMWRLRHVEDRHTRRGEKPAARAPPADFPPGRQARGDVVQKHQSFRSSVHLSSMAQLELVDVRFVAESPA